MPTPEQTLQKLAGLDLDYPAFIAKLPAELTQTTKPLPEGLADDMLALLREERTELSEWLDKQSDDSPPDKFCIDPGSGLALAAILFLLRTHIRFTGPHFIIEHKPMDSDLLKKVIDTLNGSHLVGKIQKGVEPIKQLLNKSEEKSDIE